MGLSYGSFGEVMVEVYVVMVFGSSGGSFLGFYLWVLGELKVEV